VVEQGSATFPNNGGENEAMTFQGLCGFREGGRGISRRELLSSLASIFVVGRWLKGQEDSTLSVDVRVVNVLATVRNKQGQIIRDLNRDDFTLEEDGRPQAIRYFSRETDLSLTLGLLVDTSLSQRRLLGQERSASFRFLDQVLREDKDEAFLIHFDREVELLQDLTSSRRRLETSLRSLETPPAPQSLQRFPTGSPGSWPGGSHRRGGGTLLYDAVFLASDELMRKQRGRKAVIVLSDGVDTGSKESLTNAIESAQRSDTLAYSILFADRQAYAPMGGYGPHTGGRDPHGGGPMRYPFPQQTLPDGKKVLERLSRETGGGFFEVSEKQPIDQIYERIQEELRNQYSLGYTPDRANSGEGYHKIRLMTKQKGLIVQTRDGYYAGSSTAKG
jgi:VWFA-related protein